MKSFAVCVFLVLSTFEVAAATEPPHKSVEELVAEGVRLHDAGQFDQAIQRYKDALAVEPDSSLAWYELTNTYLAAQRYDLCEEAGRKGLRKSGKLEGQLAALVASCLDSEGKTKQALRVFEDALKKYPDDPLLNFNIAVTLFREGSPQEAAAHLQRTIEVKPFYASPYFILGMIAGASFDAPSGIFYYLRFVSLQPGSERVPLASAQVFELLERDVSEDGKGGVTITLSHDFDKKEGSLGALEVSRTMAAAAMHLPEEQAKSKAERLVSALTTFIQIADELVQGENGAQIGNTFVWKWAVLPILEIKKRGLLECFGHVLAAQAHQEGAEEWLKKNAGKRQELDAVLAELAK